MVRWTSIPSGCLWLVAFAVTTPVACQTKSIPSDAPTAITNPSDPSVASLPDRPAEDLWSRQKGEDWTRFLGPRGDGTSVEKGVDPALWNPHPKLLWTLDLGVSYGGPAVAKGRVLQFDRRANAERLRAFHAETGQLLWTWEDKVQYEDMYGYNNGPRCMPIVDNDLVYLYGVSGKLSCVSLAEGKSVWQRDLSQEFGVVQNFFGVASAPCVHGDLLWMMVGGSPPESQNIPSGRLDMVQTNGSAIVALEKASGKLRYKVGDDLASYSTPTVQRLGERVLGLAFARSGLLAWDVENGKQVFSFPWRADFLESVNAAQPLVSGRQILISEAYAIGSTMLEVDGDQPKVVWQDGKRRSEQAFRAHWSTPALIDGHLYGCSGRNGPDSDFRCVRWKDAKVMWTWREPRNQRASVLSVDGYLLVLYENGVLDLVQPNPEKYELIRSVDLSRLPAADGTPLLDEPCWAAPVLSHGLLLVRGNSHLLCFDLIPVP